MKPRMTDVVLPPTFEQTADAGNAAGYKELLAAAEDWLWYAEGALIEFDDEPCDLDDHDLCPKCENVGCISLKIWLLRQAIAKAKGGAA